MRPLTALQLINGFAALLLAGTAQAQLYRSVGPDGRVTYSDRPPAAANNRPASSNASGGAGGGAPDNASLPYELRQIAQRYPVTLYVSKDCVPCNSGRNLLINRGVPFSEKTVSTNEDIDALQRLTGGEGSVPMLTIGGQQLKGFSDADWSQYLDAAGYPKTSQLPSSYRPPAATPLVTKQAAAAAVPASPANPEPEPASPSIAPERSISNPAGIRF